MTEPTEIWIATTNQGKLREFKMLLNPWIEKKQIIVKSQGDLSVFHPMPENGDSFLANARIKTRALKSVKPGVWVMGEDSGLAVEGLGGLPGINSARYAGPKATDPENNLKLLKMMGLKQLANRNASFICSMVVFDPQGTEYVFEGAMKGSIALKEAGKTGFGYDPLFIPEGQESNPPKTLAELGLAAKNRLSHRTQATQKLIKLLEAQKVLS